MNAGAYAYCEDNTNIVADHSPGGDGTLHLPRFPAPSRGRKHVRQPSGGRMTQNRILSSPKIISARSDDAIRTELVWQ
jgi:hypothetical protein